MNHNQLFIFHICHRLYTVNFFDTWIGENENVSEKSWTWNQDSKKVSRKIHRKKWQFRPFCPIKFIRPISPEHSCAAEVTRLRWLWAVWKWNADRILLSQWRSHKPYSYRVHAWKTWFLAPFWLFSRTQCPQCSTQSNRVSLHTWKQIWSQILFVFILFGFKSLKQGNYTIDHTLNN